MSLTTPVGGAVFAISLLLTAALGAASPQREQPPSLCTNSMVTDACRGFTGRQQPTGRGCHEQLLMIVCSVRSLRCPFGQPLPLQPLPGGLPPPPPPPLENPICLQSCLRVFRRCSSSGLSLLSYLTITDNLCASLPNRLCNDWREHSQRDDRSTGEDKESATNICRPSGPSPCHQVMYIGDIAKRQRRGASVRLKHPFKKSNFREGNYTYVAVVKLAKAEWRQETTASQQPAVAGQKQSQESQPQALMQLDEQPPSGRLPVYNGGYVKVLHLEIIQILYTRGTVDRHIKDPGSIQIVRVPPGCACAPVKLDQSLIFVGHNAYLKNVFNAVTLLPNNSHYVCKIKRCWNKRRRSSAAASGGRGGGLADCECPCGKAERRRCQRRRHAKRRRGATGSGGRGGGGRRLSSYPYGRSVGRPWTSAG